MKLVRNAFTADGIFGVILDDSGKQLAVTLEHAYPSGNGFMPKIPPGTYTCTKGTHQLAGMAAPFETFEVTHVPGHTNILIHMGNYNKDSEGCILLGETCTNAMITNSKITFQLFMSNLSDTNSFQLSVS